MRAAGLCQGVQSIHKGIPTVLETFGRVNVLYGKVEALNVRLSQNFLNRDIDSGGEVQNVPRIVLKGNFTTF